MTFRFLLVAWAAAALAACGGGVGVGTGGGDGSGATSTAPAISTEPQSASVTAGQTATFSVAATGSSLSYQWEKNGVAIDAATAASYTTPAEVLTDNGSQFAVVVSNPIGSVTSTAATLSVTATETPVTITTQPASQSTTEGGTATFRVVAGGTAPLTYQWYKNGVAIGGATAFGYTTPAEPLTDNGSQFTVVVSNSVSSATSTAATLSVTTTAAPVSITTQPTSQSTTEGGTVTFSVVASGTAPFTYQWYKNSIAISGAAASSYTTPAESLSDNGAQFTVVVSNSIGSVTSTPAALSVTATATPVTIITQPTSQSTTEGGTATFSVVASGTAPTYQWYRNNIAIGGATAASYTTPTESLSDNGAQFMVVVSNSLGSVTSTAVTLSVAATTIPVTIATQPASQSITEGGTATFSVVASGTAPFTYQWYKNSVAISGAAASSYTTPAESLSDDGAQFTVVVSNSADSVTSTAATLNVAAAVTPVAITTQPTSKGITQGDTATFSVVASGTAPTYQWYKNSVAISGATAASYTTPTESLSDNGAQFTVVVSNSANSVTSSAATLSVTATATPVSITTQPTSQSTTKGGTATFSVVVSGTAPTYQWYKNGVAISGAAASSYTTPAAVAADSGAAFTVTVNGAANVPVTSDPATLYVTGTLSLIAGELGGFGHTDGTGSAASFYTPVATATDSTGNVYVIDQVNQLIRRITPAGVVTTLAGRLAVTGSADGACANATFNNPSGIATDSADNLYIADTSNDTIRKITMPACTVSTLAGSAGNAGAADGTGTAARFAQPQGLAVDAIGNVYVADSGSDLIRKITPTGMVSTLAGSDSVAGSTDATGANARFNMPVAIAVDPTSGTLYVADYLNSTIRRISSAGVVTTLAGTPGTFGSSDGIGAAASFDGPTGLALDNSAANLYIADPYNRTIRKLAIGSKTVTTIAGGNGVTGWLDATGGTAQFAYPAALASDGANNLFVADSDNNMIREVAIPSAAVTTLAGSIGGRGYQDATGSAALFSNPHNVAADSNGNIFVGDYANNVIRKIAPGGIVTTFVGTAGVTGSADGTGAAAQFNSPFGMVFDSHGNMYMADSVNNTIRMITPAGQVSTFAGTAGAMGSNNGTGAAARFNSPYNLAIDASDTLYVTDFGNNTIRKITTPNAVVTTLAGTPGTTGSADGTGPAARFNGPHGVAIDRSTGNLYIADRFNDTIRKITPAGVVTTVAGTPGETDFVDGTGADAHFNSLGSLGIDDSTGNIYITDYLHNAVRLLTPARVVTTIVGRPGSTGTVLGDLPGQLTGPSSIVVLQGAALHLVIADSLENAVLLATPP